MVRLTALYPRSISSLSVDIDIYLASGSDYAVSLPVEVRRDLMTTLRNVVSLDAPFDSTQRHLLNKMYNNQFQVR